MILIAAPLAAQQRARTIGSILDPALGTRVSVEALRAAGNQPASIMITVFSPAEPALIRLSLPKVTSLVSMSDSVLGLPAPVVAGESTYFPIYTSPLDSGATLTTSRFVTDQGDLMQIQVNTTSTSAIAMLSRKAAVAFIAVLGKAVTAAGASPKSRQLGRRP